MSPVAWLVCRRDWPSEQRAVRSVAAGGQSDPLASPIEEKDAATAIETGVERSGRGASQLSAGRLGPRSGRFRDRAPLPVVLLGCGVLLVAAMALGVTFGSVGLSPAAVWQVLLDHLTGHPKNTVADEIVWQIRVPRVLLAAVVGAALTTAGTVVQALVRNALADPFLLGVSSGASVGATLVLLFGAFASLGIWALSVGSVLGAMGAMATVFLVSRTGRQLAPTQLILCGVVLSAMFEAVTSFLIFRGNPQATQAVLFWLMGSFGNANWTQLPIPTAVLLVGIGFLLAQARSLNALAMGAEPAASLGVDVARLRRNLFVVTSLMVGVAVAVSGIIGFVGLIIPHIVRLLVGSDHRRVLAVGVPVGAAFMVVADLLARTIVSPQEMPIGVITAFIGAPTLLVLIRRRPYLYGATQ
jgi:iron complex transport system permease protein